MKLSQRYKTKETRKSRMFRFFSFYILLSFFLIFYSTFARYTTVIEGSATVTVANWKIEINNNNIVENNVLTNLIELVPNTQTTTNNKLAPGQKGEFDITINPTGTDVAIEYIINFNLLDLPTGIILTTYKIVEDNISGNIENNQMIGEINLNSNQLVSTDQKTIRIFWEWEEDSVDIPVEQVYKIEATVKVQQKIN